LRKSFNPPEADKGIIPRSLWRNNIPIDTQSDYSGVVH